MSSKTKSRARTKKETTKMIPKKSAPTFISHNWAQKKRGHDLCFCERVASVSGHWRCGIDTLMIKCDDVVLATR